MCVLACISWERSGILIKVYWWVDCLLSYSLGFMYSTTPKHPDDTTYISMSTGSSRTEGWYSARDGGAGPRSLSAVSRKNRCSFLDK